MPSLVARPPGVSSYSKSGSGSRRGTAREGRPGPHAGRPVTREGLAGHHFVTFALENVTRGACRDFAHDRTHVYRAQHSSETMFSLAGAERQQVLTRLHGLILKRQDEILDLVQLEAGKARMDAFDEVSATALVAGYYGKRSARILASKRVAGVIPLFTKARTLHHPKGVVSIISPWNYPLALTAMDVLPALAAGNAVVQKPDNQTARSALW